MEVWRKRQPNHRPAWVTIGVKELAVTGMHFEITAEAVLS
jgi:enamine deaminase RidA (YjgF/YER057c/UK114 family)